MSEQLWCVHIEGLNDFIAVDSEEAARQEASAINAYIDGTEREHGVAMLHAVVVEWPFSAAGHARALDGDWHDLQRMRHRQTVVNQTSGVLANMARRVKELVSVTLGK